MHRETSWRASYKFLSRKTPVQHKQQTINHVPTQRTLLPVADQMHTSTALQLIRAQEKKYLLQCLFCVKAGSVSNSCYKEINRSVITICGMTMIRLSAKTMIENVCSNDQCNGRYHKYKWRIGKMNKLVKCKQNHAGRKRHQSSPMVMVFFLTMPTRWETDSKSGS